MINHDYSHHYHFKNNKLDRKFSDLSKLRYNAYYPAVSDLLEIIVYYELTHAVPRNIALSTR